MWLEVIPAFLIFCMVSGGEYIINDIIDREEDNIHPVKSNRPIASGDLSIFYASTSAVLLITIGLLGAWFLNILFFVSVITYLILILAYSMILKHFVLVDVLTISSGFVIRAIAGCVVIGAIISPWLILCAFFLALFLALGKRRHELVLMGSESKNHREILDGCSAEMIDYMVIIVTAVLIMSYSLYTFLMDNQIMMVTIPFVVYGIFRCHYLIHKKNYGGESEMLFKDRGLLISLSLWLLIVILVLYITKHYTPFGEL
jgi:4-hydroxybenzoate polyprenyltransferase